MTLPVTTPSTTASTTPATCAAPTPVVELVDVVKQYPGSPPLTILHGLSTTIGSGELVAVVGPSGSGKTTMLSLMGTLDAPTSGEVRIAGEDVARMGELERAALRARRIGFVFQQFFLLPSVTAWENVATGLLYQGIRSKERRLLAHEALERVGLGHRTDHRPGQLSGGEQQRVAIARAVVGSPDVLFADEPTGALDTRSGKIVLDLLTDVAAGGTTVVVITHDLELAASLPRRISIRDGRIVMDERDAA